MTHQYLVYYLCCLSKKKLYAFTNQVLIIKLKQIPNLSFLFNILDLFIFQNKQPDNIGLLFKNNLISATNVFLQSQISYCILVFNRKQETTVQERIYCEINKVPPYRDYYFNNTLSTKVVIISYSFRTLLSYKGRDSSSRGTVIKSSRIGQRQDVGGGGAAGRAR